MSSQMARIIRTTAFLSLLPVAWAWAGCSSDDTNTPFPGGTGGAGGAGGDGGSDVQCPGATNCDGLCTDTDLDPDNCGDCGVECDAGMLCSIGQCGVDCLGGTTQCDDLCVDTNVDPANCGGCGTEFACEADEVCSAGQCGFECIGGTTECDGLCIDTNVDPANCGGCGANFACAAEEVCSVGQCGFDCIGGSTECNGLCVDTQLDPANCGGCGGSFACASEEVCSGGQCGFSCIGGTTECNGLCVDIQVDPANCGGCGGSFACASEEVCSGGQCGFTCIGGTTECNGFCVDTTLDPANCGGCGGSFACAQGEVCVNSTCSSVCGGNLTMCGNSCVDLQTDHANCGGCGGSYACTVTEDCIAGVCVECDSNTTDCDGDGWMVADGDCCDKAGTCGYQPELVNPGAIEVLGNGIDDNCNNLTDLFDLQDTLSCDNGLASDSANPVDFARALGICRQTTETPTNLVDKTWGLISAELLRADGSALGDARAASIRPAFGTAINVLEGQSMVVISSGIAADATQTTPGPIGGAATSHSPGGSVNIATCTNPNCINDWFVTANPPIKGASELPVAPNCGSGTAGSPSTPNDSVMIKLRLRAPTNAKAFSFNSYFFSAEYAEYVCSNYNDQFIALVDTPSGTPSPLPNPVDKNLMTYNDGNQSWPIGINIASGTSLFSVCEPQGVSTCWDTDVSPASCQLGAAQLDGTGFGGTGCTVGGGTYWLTTAGNIIPGEILELRIVIWDVGDTTLDSLALVDGFQWLANSTLPGTG